MGKIRIKTLGDEEQEKKDSKKAQAKAEAKKTAEAAKKAAEDRASEETGESDEAKVASEVKEEIKQEKKPKKKDKFKKSKESSRSKSYLAVAGKLEKGKTYKLTDALSLLPDIKMSKFDETVELHINTTEQGVSGSITLPHGTGKAVRVAIANQTTDPKGVEELVKKVEGGVIDFDVLIATPDAMPKLAKIARFLGPKGLMPNPKNGTVTGKPDEIAKKFEGGQMNFKTEAKAPILHLSVGKISFGDKKLAENIKALVAAVNAKKIKDATLKSTMSPGIKIDVASI